MNFSVVIVKSNMQLNTLLFSVSLAVVIAAAATRERSFSDDFLFGAASAAYQIEGAWNTDGKGESIWDHVLHTKPETVSDHSNGDVASDSYHNYKRDVEMMRELGLNAYRFSISWPRVLPTGFTNNVNPAGVAFYNNYIDEMIKYNITPIVTLYHWDLPQKLQDLGGFTNPYIIDWFEEYARTVFNLFGDRVKHWIPFNEPTSICFLGYSGDEYAPQLNASRTGDYLCTRHLILAHARVYHTYSNHFKASQKGEIGTAQLFHWIEPLTDSDEDHLAAELYQQVDWGLYIHPIFSEEGGFPKEIKEVIDKSDIEKGLTRPSLPDFTDEEKSYIKGTADFLGFNYYLSFLVSASTSNSSFFFKFNDVNVGIHYSDDWIKSTISSDWFRTAPKGLYNVLNMIKEKYNNPKIFITEHGWPTYSGLEDDSRVDIVRMAMVNCLEAVENDIKVKGYMSWSLMDSYEWVSGYSNRMGLYEVDFSSPARTRTPRKSAFVYKQIIKSRVVDYSYEPDITQITIDDEH